MTTRYKYHRGKEHKGRCMGAKCVHCWMLGRSKDLYGNNTWEESKRLMKIGVKNERKII